MSSSFKSSDCQPFKKIYEHNVLIMFSHRGKESITMFVHRGKESFTMFLHRGKEIALTSWLTFYRFFSVSFTPISEPEYIYEGIKSSKGTANVRKNFKSSSKSIVGNNKTTKQ